jgi:hypothetical protein
VTYERCSWCGSLNTRQHRQTFKHRGAWLARLFWTHNAVAKDEYGNVRIVGRMYRDQPPVLPPKDAR